MTRVNSGMLKSNFRSQNDPEHQYQNPETGFSGPRLEPVTYPIDTQRSSSELGSLA
jgi:hypothetical protein